MALSPSLDPSRVNAQQSDTSTEEARELAAAPKSPNGLPMEAIFDFAPEAPGGKLTATGPYLVSRWGGIVVRGRPEGDHVVSALSTVQCGSDQNPATQITVIGVPPDGLCADVSAVPAGESSTFLLTEPENLFGTWLFGTSSGWTGIEFSQTVDKDAAFGGLKLPATGSEDGKWGLSRFGAVFRNENGLHVFYAPGETVTLPSGVTFVVKPAMKKDDLKQIDESDFAANFEKMDAALAKLGEIKIPEAPKIRTHGPAPLWAKILVVGFILALGGGAIYGIRRLIRRFRRPGPAGDQATNA